MTICSETEFGSSTRLYDAINMVRVTFLVFKVVFPIAALTIAILAFAHLAYLNDPKRAQAARNLSTDQMIVLEQLHRSETIKADTAFLGDSSCLMGIYVPSLPSRWGSSEGFCTLAYVGPAGYAIMLDRMIDRGTAPSRLILVLHPIQFQRQTDWDTWVDVVKDEGQRSTTTLKFPWSALDFLRFEWLVRWLYSPLPGSYGLFYGGEDSFRNIISEHNGSAVDPGVLRFRTVAEAAAARPSNSKPTDFLLSAPFMAALNRLGSSIRKYGPQHVRMIISPIPKAYFSQQAATQRKIAAIEIAKMLSLKADQIIDTPATYPDGFFSSYTHLNRFGRMIFTKDIATLIGD
jgi:hypothetical protein